MTIYIASSWKNEHAVVMLTQLLRDRGHEVRSFIENNERTDQSLEFEDWVCSEDARRCFDFDTAGATQSDLVIYVAPSGSDAWAEVGAAWGAGVQVLGLAAKGEQVGLMRHMVHWEPTVQSLLEAVELQAVAA